MIKWKRSSDGYVDSHDGVWRITPLFCGCVKPQMFDLYRNDQKVGWMLPTQKAAKEQAEEIESKAK
jgi:hypothetical protein